MIRIAASSSYVWHWSPSNPAAYATAATPSLSIFWASGTTTHALDARAADTLTAISADRRRLTLTWGADGVLAADSGGRPMPVWFDGGAEHQGPGLVSRLVSDAGLTGIVELASPLPIAVDVGASVKWQDWSATLSSIPATVQGPVRWQIDYSAIIDGQDGGSVVEEGELLIVDAPFATGLSDAALIARSPWLTGGRPHGQQGWAPQIEAGLARLIRRIKKRLTDGSTIEDLTGPQFIDAHAAETRKLILVALQESGQDRRAAIDQAEADVVGFLDDIFGGLAGDGDASAARMVPLSHANTVSIFDPSDSDAVAPDSYDRIRVTGFGER